MSLDKDYLKDLFTDEVKGCLKSDGDPVGTAANAVSEHNTSEDAHSDIRELINSGPFLVTITARSDGTLSSDKTYEEIRSAINNGKVVFASYENAGYSVMALTEGSIIFGVCGTDGMFIEAQTIIIDINNVVMFEVFGVAEEKIVELFDDAHLGNDGSNIINLTPSEIIQAVNDGKIVIGDGRVWSLSGGSDDQVVISALLPPDRVEMHTINSDKSYTTTFIKLVTNNEFAEHSGDSDRHLRPAERMKWNKKSDFSGSYNDLSDKPTIPTVPSNVSAFTNDAGYLTQHQDISGKANSSDLTAHTGNSTVHITSAERTKWNAKSDFSGSYNDLTNKPTIPTVPTKVSAFTNDAGYLTHHQDISGKANVSDLTAHTGNSTVHVTAAEKAAWNENALPSVSPSDSGKILMVNSSGVPAWTTITNAEGVSY